MSCLEAVGARRIVIVRSYRLGHAPICDGQLRIEFRGMLKRSRCLIVIKGIDKAQSLIEKLLRLSMTGAHRMMKISQPRDHGHRPGRSMRCMILRRNTKARKHSTSDRCQHFHGLILRDQTVGTEETGTKTKPKRPLASPPSLCKSEDLRNRFLGRVGRVPCVNFNFLDLAMQNTF